MMMSKKTYLTIILLQAMLLVVVIFLLGAILYKNGKLRYKDRINNLQQLIPILSRYDFKNAKITGKKIVFEPTSNDAQEIALPGVTVRQVLWVEKKGNGYRFILGGAVDDEFGLIYSPSNNLASFSFANLYRVIDHENWYEFDTMSKE